MGVSKIAIVKCWHDATQQININTFFFLVKFSACRNKGRRRWRPTTRLLFLSPWWRLASGSCTLEWESSSWHTCTRNVRTQSRTTLRWRTARLWRSIRGQGERNVPLCLLRVINRTNQKECVDLHFVFTSLGFLVTVWKTLGSKVRTVSWRGCPGWSVSTLPLSSWGGRTAPSRGYVLFLGRTHPSTISIIKLLHLLCWVLTVRPWCVTVVSSRSEPWLALVGSDAQYGASGRHHGYAAVRLSRGEFCAICFKLFNVTIADFRHRPS